MTPQPLAFSPTLRRLGVAAQGPGLDQEEGVGVQLALDVAGQGLGGLLVGAGLFAGQAQAHQAAAAHHRQGRQLVLQLGRMAVQVAVGQLGGVERIVGPLEQRLASCVGAIAHHAPVAAVDDHGPDVGVGSRRKRSTSGRLDRIMRRSLLGEGSLPDRWSALHAL
jgi:hypothetical protein